MTKLIGILTATLLLLLVSCEEKTTWDLGTSEKFGVADCILTNEMKTQELRLYRSSEKLNELPAGISGALVEINDGNRTVKFTEAISEAGKYVSEVPFRATAGIRYRLTVSLGEKSDTAYAVMSGITPLENIDIAAKDSAYRLVYHESEDASMMEVYYDWSAVPDFCQEYGHCEASEVYYTLDNIDAEKIFAPDRQIITFPKETRIIRRKYSLSDAHQQFIRALLLETEWRGGLFDAEQGNVPTNFSHGLRGWFGACTVVTDTTRFR
jgi:hypothetical protein